MTASQTSLPAIVTITPIVSKSPPVEAAADALGVHPAARLFPLMQGPELGLLIEDIEANGLREPIVLYDGQILDGRNRLRACELAGIEPRFVEWDGAGSPVAFVMSRNLHRRHLNESQRSIIGARAKGMFEEEAAERKAATQFGAEPQANTAGGVNDEKHRETTVFANLQRPSVYSHVEAANLVNVSPRSISTASKVLESGDEQVIDAISDGTITVSDAAAVVELPKPKQREALEEVRHGRARTLRQAAKIQDEEETPQAASRQVGDQLFSRKRLRVECKRFAIDLDKLLKRVDAVAMACGGPNDYTQRARDCLSVALRAIQECLMNCNRPVQS